MVIVQFDPDGKISESSGDEVSNLLHQPGVLEELMKHIPMPPVDPSISPATCELSTSIIGESMRQGQIPDLRLELRTKETGTGIDAKIVQSNLALSPNLQNILGKVEHDLQASTTMPPMHLHFSGSGAQPDGTHCFTLNIYPANEYALKREPVGSISFRLTVHKAA